MTASHSVQLDITKTDILDQGGVYDQWHAYARQAFRRPTAATDGAFREIGYQRLRLLDDDLSARCMARAQAFEADPGQKKDEREYQNVLKTFDQEACLEILDSAFSGPLDGILTDHFGAEYFVFKFSIGVTRPTSDPDLSLAWHMDGGPPAFVNLLIYLNGTDEHDSTTEFLDRDVSRRLREAGYSPGLEDRLDDLGTLAGSAGVEYAPYAEPVAAGEGVLFDARYVLHRGRAPTKGSRFLLSLCILPSMLHWRESFGLWTVDHLNAFDGGWGLDFLGALVPAVAESDRLTFNVQQR